ncbi:MAG: Glycosyl transferase family 2 [candidate division WS6 bacterium GW2011_GWE1_34_7]|uniref:Glycosyl transferase family 2 n=1 Tax=candidate division WS6 bacterium GW2011_GWE1_34_7 TaxID=1619093 RepID=A0A0G0DMJ0_9BACT|nr:MAG: Glycosyl transferase family 2 [candidate division WS6 bacterium GW2011_GWE1_34_7]
MKLIIYMPALNEEEGISDVIKSLPKKIEGIDEIKVLVVDDGSTDDTAKKAKQSDADVVSHNVNKGVGSAFQSAVQYALENEADILVSIDADRQFNSEQIPEIIQPILKDKADMVTGNRFEDGMPKDMPKSKYWGNTQMSRLISIISGQKFRDVSCGFRAYNREALLRLNLFGAFTYTQETILDMVFKGLRIVEFPVDVIYFKDRKSRVAGSIVKYAFRTSQIILTTLKDYKPMLFFGGMGGICLAVGLILEMFLGVYFLITGDFSPYKFVGFTGFGFLIFGLLLIIVGLLADMFNRVRVNQERILYELKRERYED